jgi:hypothetical protein
MTTAPGIVAIHKSLPLQEVLFVTVQEIVVQAPQIVDPELDVVQVVQFLKIVMEFATVLQCIMTVVFLLVVIVHVLRMEVEPHALILVETVNARTAPMVFGMDVLVQIVVLHVLRMAPIHATI